MDCDKKENAHAKQCVVQETDSTSTQDETSAHGLNAAINSALESAASEVCALTAEVVLLRRVSDFLAAALSVVSALEPGHILADAYTAVSEGVLPAYVGAGASEQITLSAGSIITDTTSGLVCHCVQLPAIECGLCAGCAATDVLTANVDTVDSKLQALLVANVEPVADSELWAFVVADPTGVLLLEHSSSLHELLEGCSAGDYLEPPSDGTWYWEGVVIWDNGTFECPDDKDIDELRGMWRKATVKHVTDNVVPDVITTAHANEFVPACCFCVKSGESYATLVGDSKCLRCGKSKSDLVCAECSQKDCNCV